MRGAGDRCFAAYDLPESTIALQTATNELTGTTYRLTANKYTSVVYLIIQ